LSLSGAELLSGQSGPAGNGRAFLLRRPMGTAIQSGIPDHAAIVA
jgi:hypothetical protein